ncbi:MAG: glycerol-3-phosphate dehydrogenase [Elusimicrobia bacterium CG06_land_8_20_14_3_00_38_11]|nr:MAG: glycerol-3-phosphate dehydrogenase [Elusimicrobia bacterium CG06_land_8_20_14_3_00_38_11]
MKIAVIGAGAWGTTLAQHLIKNGHQITLWEFDKSRLEYLKTRRHPLFFHHVNLDKNILLTNALAQAVTKKDIIVLAVPSQTMRDTSKKIKRYIDKNQIFVIVSKGIEIKTGKLLSEVIREELNLIAPKNITALSGPSFAKEVVRGLPTTMVSAGDKKNSEIIQKIFSAPNLRIYTNSDIIGVEVGGAVKNVIAIAAGIAYGMGLGDNTAAAIITRGLVEVARLGIKLGAKKETFAGLTGMGDLVMTAFSKNSRNRNFGELIGSGVMVKNASRKIGMVVEGIPTTEAVIKLSKKLKIEMPITNEVHKIIFENKNPKSAILSLMMRNTKPE